MREVRVHRADDKPDFVQVEREGDPSAALAAAYVHGANAAVSQTLAKYAAEQLTAAGYAIAVVPTQAAVLVSISVSDAPRAAPNGPRNSLVGSLRGALLAAHERTSSTATLTPALSPTMASPCGTPELASVPSGPSYRNTVLAAVGSGAALTAIRASYEADAAWPDSTAPLPTLPGGDEFTSSPGTDPAELIVAVRTPQRQRVIPAAREVGAPASLLSLLAESHAGGWQLRSSLGSFVPGGGCLSVHLEAQQSVAAVHAARTAKAVLRELRWVLTEQTADEDSRFNILEATSAEEAAGRAAWEAVTRRDAIPDASPTGFVHYRGDVVSATWKSLLEAQSPSAELPMVARDEPGQGRVWALLTNPCALPSEDNTSAGHTAAALLAMSRSTPQSNLAVSSSWEHQGLAGWQRTHEAGAEDRLAETLARSILQARTRPDLANQLLRQSESALDTAPWTLALTLATNGHPSWLSARSTPQSRALFDSGALNASVDRFLAGPLRLSVLTNQGEAQSARLAARLTHLLSGVHTPNAECPSADSGPNASPAGEYEIATPDADQAVALYVVDRRFAAAVRHLADGLNQPEGWLRRAVEPLGARVNAVGLGTPTTIAAVGFTLSSDGRDAMDAALAQLRTLVADLAKAPPASLTPPPLPRPSGPLDRLTRLLATEDDEATARPNSVSALIAEGLTERRLFVVRPLARPKAPNSSNPK